MSANNAISVSIHGGAKICVPDSVALLTPYVLLEQEDWFEDEIRFVRRLLRPGMAAVDVGASFGIFTMAMANAVGPRGKVWAFEPTPDTAEFLRATFALNEAHQVHLTRAAVSDQPGTVEFVTSPNSELNAVATGSGASGEALSVPSQTLDRAAVDHGWRDVDFVKLDVEGHELQVISGGQSFFATVSPLVMFEVRTPEGVDLRPLTQFQAMGYAFYRLVPASMLLVPFAPGQALDAGTLNLFACKPDRAECLAGDGILAVGDATAPAPAKDVWRSYLESAPYAREAARGWPSKPGWFASSDAKVYLQALALFAQSRDTQYGGAARLALLGRAAELVAAATQEQSTLPRLLTSARLAWELGWRASAVQLLESANQRMQTEDASVHDEPFLTPSTRYERLVTGAPTDDWVRCAIIEQWEKLRMYSSYFAGTASLPLLEAIAGVGYRSPEMERRRQLIRIRAGMQSGREANPLVCRQSEEHLNPALWCSAGR